MIDQPQRFEEAINFILNQDSIPADEWDEDLWRDQESDVTLRAFWSSRVESFRLLDRAQAFLFDTLAGVTETGPDANGVERTILRGGGRAKFVREMREFLIKEGIVSDEDEFFDVNNNDVTDIRSEARLRLIYDTNIRQAHGFGQWRQGQTPAILRRFPAQRFVRVRNVAVERDRHAEGEGDIRLKSDEEYWADFQNDPEIGGFGVPWAPFGFNSGMDVRDVTAEDAEEAGLDISGVRGNEDRNLNENLRSSIRNLKPETRQNLVDELRSFRARDAGEAGRAAALRVRERNGSVEFDQS